MGYSCENLEQTGDCKNGYWSRRKCLTFGHVSVVISSKKLRPMDQCITGPGGGMLDVVGVLQTTVCAKDRSLSEKLLKAPKILY